MPYLKSGECKILNLLPGAILTGDFTPARNLCGPHQEDNNHTALEFEGPCTSTQFRNALLKGGFESVEKGFEITLPPNPEFIPMGHPVRRSIITIRVAPRNLEVIEDAFKPGKIKLPFKDGSGHPFGFIGVTDLGFHNYAQEHREANDLRAVNQLLQSQLELFLRIGLSREYKAPDGRTGYWLQVNGIYTFPHYHEGIRRHSN
jgi:hypothetical protein